MIKRHPVKFCPSCEKANEALRGMIVYIPKGVMEVKSVGIREYIRKNPGKSNSMIAERFGCSHAHVWTLRRGMVKKVWIGRGKKARFH